MQLQWGGGSTQTLHRSGTNHRPRTGLCPKLKARPGGEGVPLRSGLHQYIPSPLVNSAFTMHSVVVWRSLCCMYRGMVYGVLSRDVRRRATPRFPVSRLQLPPPAESAASQTETAPIKHGKAGGSTCLRVLLSSNKGGKRGE